MISPKVSSCVDCGLALIGERLRCPACHALHADVLVATPVEVEDRRTPAPVLLPSLGEDDVTVPRPRAVVGGSDDAGATTLDFVSRWLSAAVLFIAIALGLVLGARECMP